MNEKKFGEDDIRQFDESTTALIRTIPSLLWGLFQELKKQGFTESQAMQLTTKYLDTLGPK